MSGIPTRDLLSSWISLFSGTKNNNKNINIKISTTTKTLNIKITTAAITTTQQQYYKNNTTKLQQKQNIKTTISKASNTEISALTIASAKPLL